MYAMIRHYKYDAAHAERVNRLVAEKFAPLIRKMPGFVRWDWIDCGHGEGASLSIFLDRDGAEASLKLAREFTTAHLAEVEMGKPQIIEGRVVAQA